MSNDEIERLQKRIERLREHLTTIARWSQACQTDLERAHELLQAGGLTLDAISAHAMRHVIEGVGDIAHWALEEPSTPGKIGQ
jgi:hypothetical protein